MNLQLSTSEKFTDLIQEYIENKKTMKEVADEVGISKAYLSYVFNRNIFPNPIELRLEFQKKVYLKVEWTIERSMSVDGLIKKHPFLKDKRKIQRLVREGKINTKKPVLTKKDIEKNKMYKEVISEFESGDSTTKIREKHKISRGLLISILYTEYGESGISKAKEIVNERARQK